MYIGIGPESKKRVLEEDAFSYACDRIYSGTEEEQDVAMQIFREAENFHLAALELVEWFYSGNWIKGLIWKQSISSDVRTAGWVVLQKGTRWQYS